MKHSLRVFKILSDPVRLRILLLLLRRELCLYELTYILGTEQFRISHRVIVLRHSGLKRDTREGKWIIYRVLEDKKKDLKIIFGRLIRDDPKDSIEATRDIEMLKTPQTRSARNCPAAIKGEKPE